MNNFIWQQPWALLALALAPVLALLFRRARLKREALLRTYGGTRSQEITAHSRERRRAEGCAVAAVVLISLALARPGANPQPRSSPQGGRDVVFVLDVSRSMLCEDVHPSRLERAKLDIARCLDSLGNDRVGLVVFAGAAAIRCPLTTDYGFFREMLKDALPNSVPRGSTYLELGLEKTTDRLLATNRAGFQDVILLTDGGDQGSHPERSVAVLNQAGGRLLVVGYGDPKIGARVPEGEGDTNGFLVYNGQEVWTTLDETSLQSLASAVTQGRYAHGGTAAFDLGRTYQAWSANAPRQFLKGRTDMKYDEYFGWLLMPALALLLYPFNPLRRPKILLALMFFLFGSQCTQAANNDRNPATVTAATAANAATPDPNSFQLGMSLMHKNSFADAAKAFDTAANQATTAECAAACFYGEAQAQAAQAAQSKDVSGQIELLKAAIDAMRSARLLRPNWLAAARGLEVLYARRADAVKALKALEDEQNKLNQQTDQLQKEIAQLLAEQKRLLAAGTRLQRDQKTPAAEKIKTLNDLHSQQSELGQRTEVVRGKMLAIRDNMRLLALKSGNDTKLSNSTNSISTAFDEPLQHMNLARGAQIRAVRFLDQLDKLTPAVAAKQQAVNELQAILDAMEVAPSNQDSQDSDDDKDMSQASDSDNPDFQSMQIRGDFLSDLVNRSLPKPNFSPQDILQEQQANAQTRTKNEPGRVGKGEKDW